MNPAKTLRDAIAAHNAGRLDDAAALYGDVLKARPREALALHNLAAIQIMRGEHERAVKNLRSAIAINPNIPESHQYLGTALQALGRLDEAGAAYAQARRLRPDYFDALNSLGAIRMALGAPAEALDLFERALRLRPQSPEALFNLGLARRQLGRTEEAIEAYRQALAARPNLAHAYLGLGTLLADEGRLPEAIEALSQAAALDPASTEVRHHLALALLREGRNEDAVAACRAALALDGGSAVAHYNLGVALQRLQRLDESAEAMRAAIALAPGLVEAHCNLGIVLATQGRFEEALACYRTALALRPDYGPALANIGVPLRALGRSGEAIELYQHAVEAAPGDLLLMVNLGTLLRAEGRVDEAVAMFERALAVAPDHPKAIAELVQLRRQACDWRHWDDDQRRLLEIRDDVQPFVFLFGPGSPAEQLACAAAWASHIPRGTPFRHPPPSRRERIRVGYLSADFRRHATAFLTAEMFERHDRSRFEIVAYSYSDDDGTEMRRRLIDAFDRFVDVRDLPHDEAARRIHEDGIDIVIDLKGYTAQTRSEIIANRPAPIQVNFLGFPGTMGADFIDYIIADRFIIPAGHAPYYAEKVVQLPDCYQPNDRKRRIASPSLDRAGCQLPEGAFVFCSFNGAIKITPPVFSVWMRLLAQVPGSVLWLLNSADYVDENLRREAAARGVDPGRLIFAPGLPLDHHLARLKHADLFLDTLPVNAHTTCSDALWGGLPLLTCAGDTFASRVAGSLLCAAGLPELVAASLEEYEALALALATNPGRLRALRERLWNGRLIMPLFDSARFTRGIEAAYQVMHERHLAGLPPESFSVSAPLPSS